ncbi:MAG TPA: hypothetical protein VGM92_13300 [Candidatus Kapabacteria bacterium]
MDRDFESIAREAEQLETHEQFLLTERLARHLGRTREHKEAWSNESQARAEAIDRGEMKTLDASETLKMVRSIVRK